MYTIICSLGSMSEMLPFDIHTYLRVGKFGAADVPYCIGGICIVLPLILCNYICYCLADL
jgi:hypothetical protein